METLAIKHNSKDVYKLGIEIYYTLPLELREIINLYIKKYNWKHYISQIHNTQEWKQTYVYRKYKWLYDGTKSNDGVSVDNLTITNRTKYEITDSLRYQDFIAGNNLVREIVPLWHQFRIEPTISDIARLPYKTTILGYAMREHMANFNTNYNFMEPGSINRQPEYYARDMLSAVASELVGHIQLRTRDAKRMCRPPPWEL